MILSQTDGIVTAGLLVAHIEACVCHTVAHLAGWAVMVVNTRNTLAAIKWIVWISGERSRWTLTLRLMIVGDANGSGSTFHRITSWTTSESLGRFILNTGFRLLALCMVSAVMFLGWLTAVPIVGVTHKPVETITSSLVLTGYANRVGRAREGITDGDALKDSQDIRTTGRSIRAISVTGAVWQ